MTRKYNHSGYQDSDRDRDRDRGGERQGPRPPRQDLTEEERIHRKSLRVATNRDAREVVRCHVCGRSPDTSGGITTASACPHCRAPLHCCRTCNQFDTSSRWQCRAEISESIPDKTRANRCERYQPRLVLDSTGRRSQSHGKPSNPRAQFDNLFKR